MKRILSLISFLFFFSIVKGQRSSEELTTDWPIEYKWKVVGRQNGNGQSSITIIPGKETPAKATIIGVMTAFQGATTDNTDEMVAIFRKALDSGSSLTILEKNDSAKPRWVIFKIETPKTDKYPEPESDLYYCVQGEYALFENHVAIKTPALSPEFVTKWTKLFKASRLEK
jgi:hypothetical protein